MARAYLSDYVTPDDKIYWQFVCMAMRSHAHMCIIPIQDYLGYDNSARMNQPSTVGINWRWRITKEELSDELKDKIRTLTRTYGRLCWQWQKELDQK